MRFNVDRSSLPQQRPSTNLESNFLRQTTIARSPKLASPNAAPACPRLHQLATGMGLPFIPPRSQSHALSPMSHHDVLAPKTFDSPLEASQTGSAGRGILAYCPSFSHETQGQVDELSTGSIEGRIEAVEWAKVVLSWGLYDDEEGCCVCGA